MIKTQVWEGTVALVASDNNKPVQKGGRQWKARLQQACAPLPAFYASSGALWSLLGAFMVDALWCKIEGWLLWTPPESRGKHPWCNVVMCRVVMEKFAVVRLTVPQWRIICREVNKIHNQINTAFTDNDKVSESGLSVAGKVKEVKKWGRKKHAKPQEHTTSQESRNGLTIPPRLRHPSGYWAHRPMWGWRIQPWQWLLLRTDLRIDA